LAIITWHARDVGAVEHTPTKANPGLTRLSAPGAIFRQFDSSAALPVGPVTASIRTRSNFALYVEVETAGGSRQFKFVPTDDRQPRRRFGYRYEVGAGREVRDGNLHLRVFDLQQLAAAAEPGTIITSVERIFVRVAGEMDVELINTAWAECSPATAAVGASTLVVSAASLAACSPATDEAPGTGQPGTTTTTTVDQAAPGETPSDPPPVVPVDGAISTVEAVRFLTQATFGADAASIQALQGLASYADWIDGQLGQPASLTLPYVKATSNGSLDTTRHHIWFRNVLTGPDQLRQRLAFAWSELFVISDLDYELSNSQYSVSHYYDLLAEHAFGNFRTLLETVTLHPAMGIFLSMVRNEKADLARNVRPDENFAREVLQLFTIGLYELDENGEVRTDAGQPIPSYDQTTVEEFAKVFTGWTFAGGRSWDEGNAGFHDKEVPMVAWEEYHDTSPKRLLNGVELPAGQSAMADLTAALDNIFNHPNVGPFVSRHLIQRLVTSNPTPEYVGRVAAVFNDDGQGERGNLGAVVKALLLDPEARTGHITQADSFGKIKEPILRLTQLYRAFVAQPGQDADGIYRPRAMSVDRIDEIVGQGVMKSRSVFNFFQPDTPLRAGSEKVAPELQILTEINVASTNNMLFEQIYDFHNRSDNSDNASLGQISVLQIERELALVENPAVLVEHLDVLLTGGSMPEEARSGIVRHLETHPLDDDGRIARVSDAMFLVVGSPFHLVQK
jgi:uncharacterized protein (DUF1800 family)